MVDKKSQLDGIIYLVLVIIVLVVCFIALVALAWELSNMETQKSVSAPECEGTGGQLPEDMLCVCQSLGYPGVSCGIDPDTTLKCWCENSTGGKENE